MHSLSSLREVLVFQGPRRQVAGCWVSPQLWDQLCWWSPFPFSAVFPHALLRPKACSSVCYLFWASYLLFLVPSSQWLWPCWWASRMLLPECTLPASCSSLGLLACIPASVSRFHLPTRLASLSPANGLCSAGRVLGATLGPRGPGLGAMMTSSKF